MIKCYYINKTYYSKLRIAPIGHKSYYEWTIFGFTFKTKVKKITYQSGGNPVLTTKN